MNFYDIISNLKFIGIKNYKEMACLYDKQVGADKVMLIQKKKIMKIKTKRYISLLMIGNLKKCIKMQKKNLKN